jgi:hypothetical protein
VGTCFIFTLVCLAAAAAARGQTPASCEATPRLDCRRSAESELTLTQWVGSENRLGWKWTRGAATSQAEFGDPTTTGDFTFCLYAGSHSEPVAGLTIPANAGKWRPIAGKGYKYKDPDRVADGITMVRLKGSDKDKARIVLRGKGADLPSSGLPTSLPLRAQFVSTETGVCWEDVYDGTDILRNEVSHFEAKAEAEDGWPPYPLVRAASPLPREEAEALGVAAFVGTPATDQPLPPLAIPEHPFLDVDGDARTHNDVYNSGVYNRPGPRGLGTEVTTFELTEGGDWVVVCAGLQFDDNGYIVASCVATPNGSTRLILLDPVTLDLVAETDVAPRGFIASGAGGAYISYGQDGTILIGPANNRVEQWAVEVNGGVPAFVRRTSYDVSGEIPIHSILADTIVDWEGRLWFVTDTGEVGYIDPTTGAMQLLVIGEKLRNSTAVDATGVYVLSRQALYKFSVAPDGSIQTDWRTAYDPGSVVQGVGAGSGTTPTLLGTEDDLIAICDNADTQINLVVLDRTTGDTVCLTPLFSPGASATENSVVGYGDEVVIANNAGTSGPFSPANIVERGVEKYQVRADRTGCDPVWANDTSFGNSVQLSTTTGLIYGYGADPNVLTTDAFYLTATDWVTGDEVFRVYAGNGIAFNPVFGQMHLSPDGDAYIGSLRGIIRFADLP